MEKRFQWIILLLLLPMTGFSQDKNWSLNGYLSNIQSVFFEDIDDTWYRDDFIHNRLNFYWYPGDSWTFSLQMRNRFLYGNLLENRQIKDMYNQDNGWLDLTENLVEGPSYALNLSIDRLYLEYYKNDLSITLGRQRINWGQTFAFNPNDIFNAYSYFDFDYAERPGSDALRIQYYTGMASKLEVAAKLDSASRLTLAGLYRLNVRGYDVQFIGGYFEESDYLAGLGWSGDIKGVGFRGEFSYFHPREQFGDSTGILFASLSCDYVFTNSLSIQGEIYYAGSTMDLAGGGLFQFSSGGMNIKNIALSEFNIFASASYPITPLFNGSFAAMYFPDKNGYFAGPSLDYSIGQNIDLTFYLQNFNLEYENIFTGEKDRLKAFISYLRLRWNF